jgi:hypothetical protein
MRIAFTCNCCNHRTARAINPQAFITGTVFVQCEGCLIHHKLVDNLKLIHELRGPVFNAPFVTGAGLSQGAESGGFRVGGFELFDVQDDDDV